ncbi:hypothetical protein COW36_18895 [bacterium (Candidatus Blackallbacteria) CG17_big_fil_post_rev_8_21_14_2_50_48_46]|uniref:Uncharacterized protein n=1 Tax=bacterium (Candidatus Blackallbacteria) CG17_big_fil_post_rev_8_21_14_2_50_48_46 TaxID=2014261 RepID=A0A2M7G0K3_9BACT|nr:MAG: hypothetical protein COW64_25575 [bacterium (Candidatus Blackallbacteria) CG18_big_fil_WC_8_21_14_2_50_49_26]PIW14995.1 MAG: hypothetical protein COW36_18895 [bacterium (Candidatus Blackallbacteria) CG17_big_fil_post_rev_8_21_14_2_50_48_46]PIW50076.1 MAG: hypothetical protein COW20_03830 [bacterium (Candidatus Blackallbacteria) CG13_big_fil_rev_8_21_14_2_50_49_14]
MLVYFVSIRTAKIYGPTELNEMISPEEGIARISCPWPIDYFFDEWEGYAVVVPERVQVWGAAKPLVTNGFLQAEFAFTPVPIPPAERKLFPLQNQSLAAQTAEDEEND